LTRVVSTSPQAPEDVVCDVESLTPAAVDAIVARVRSAQPAWAGDTNARAAALEEAATMLARDAETLAELMTREVGKPIVESRAEVARAVAILRYHAQQVFDPSGEQFSSSMGLLFTQSRPRGVAGLITPWNFPVAIPIWKAAPALATGNAVVLKPAPEASAVAEYLAGVLPPDVFAVAAGDADTGEALIDAVDVVSFTGSSEVGCRTVVRAAERGIPVQAEMGGQNPAVVLADADLESAARQIAGAAMAYAGQKCTATKRVIIVGDPAPMTDALVAAVDALAVGDPSADDVAVGPVISAAARADIVASASSARSTGARVLRGGEILERKGWYVAPTLIDALSDDDPLTREEVFGPITAILRAPDERAAIELANAVEYGLVAAVYTRDLDRALRVVAALDAGLVKVNAPTAGVDFHLPFGGEKHSGYGPREQGKSARELYTSVHTVTLNRSE
jgi:acyl-CoA reductase-like NAD-dependent aldehyde dehydrogenase